MCIISLFQLPTYNATPLFLHCNYCLTGPKKWDLRRKAQTSLPITIVNYARGVTNGKGPNMSRLLRFSIIQLDSADFPRSSISFLVSFITFFRLFDHPKIYCCSLILSAIIWRVFENFCFVYHSDDFLFNRGKTSLTNRCLISPS